MRVGVLEDCFLWHKNYLPIGKILSRNDNIVATEAGSICYRDPLDIKDAAEDSVFQSGDTIIISDKSPIWVLFSTTNVSGLTLTLTALSDDLKVETGETGTLPTLRGNGNSSNGWYETSTNTTYTPGSGVTASSSVSLTAK